MISACGLVDPEGLSWTRIQRIYDMRYRHRDQTGRWRVGLAFRFDPARPEQIRSISSGCGIRSGRWASRTTSAGWTYWIRCGRYAFHDVTLNPHIRYGRHAVAMDETRRPFTPTLWAPPYAPGQDVAQVWFPGSHQDVGGGHDRAGLSDGALLWMVEETSATVGLGFNPSTVEQIRPDPLDVLQDDISLAGAFRPVVDPVVGPWLEALFQPQPRAVPRIDPDAPDPCIHPSAYERHLTPSITGGTYRPTRVPRRTATVEVFANRLWNEDRPLPRAGEGVRHLGPWTVAQRRPRIRSGGRGRPAVRCDRGLRDRAVPAGDGQS